MVTFYAVCLRVQHIEVSQAAATDLISSANILTTPIIPKVSLINILPHPSTPKIPHHLLPLHLIAPSQTPLSRLITLNPPSLNAQAIPQHQASYQQTAHQVQPLLIVESKNHIWTKGTVCDAVSCWGLGVCDVCGYRA